MQAAASQRSETMYDPSMPGHARAFHAMRLRELLDQLDVSAEKAALREACLVSAVEPTEQPVASGTRRL